MKWFDWVFVCIIIAGFLVFSSRGEASCPAEVATNVAARAVGVNDWACGICTLPLGPGELEIQSVELFFVDTGERIDCFSITNDAMIVAGFSLPTSSKIRYIKAKTYSGANCSGRPSVVPSPNQCSIRLEAPSPPMLTEVP